MRLAITNHNTFLQVSAEWAVALSCISHLRALLPNCTV